jgi:hypothetical protein
MIVKALGKSKESYPTRRVLAKLLIDHPVVSLYAIIRPSMQLQSIVSILRTVPQIDHPFPLQPSSEKRSPKKQLMMEQ